MAVKGNIIANVAGSAWSAIVGLIFAPIYIHYLGVEAYGVIGVFISFQAVLSLLDMGLATTLNREMARLSTMPEASERIHDTLRTLEWLYWAAAAVVGILAIAISPLIANHWVRPDKLSMSEIERAFFFLSIVTALRWPCGLYAGGLNGLQRQISLNVITAAAMTIQAVGSILALWLVSPTLKTYLTWQIIAVFIQVTALMIYTRSVLPKIGRKARFDRKILNQIWRFAAGMSGLSILVLLLTQLDKIILSKLLDLTMFGYYIFAVTVSGSLNRLTAPLFSAVFPKLTELSVAGRIGDLARFYHQASQLTSFLVIPASLMLIFFPREIVLAWTGNHTLAEETYLVIRLLSIGTLLNAFMSVPYTLQLAYEWTSLAFRMNVLAVIGLAPLVVILASRYGIIGPPVAWIILNSGYLIVDIKLMHQRLLPNEKREWYVKDIAVPLVAGLAIAAAARLLFGYELSRALAWTNLIAAGIAISIATYFACPRLRAFSLPNRFRDRGLFK